MNAQVRVQAAPERTTGMASIDALDVNGHTIGHYTIVALIRGGAQGRVYRARDQVLHRDVAVKVLNAAEATDVSAGGLIAEARHLSRLNHPNVAGIYDFVTHNDREFMIMEFIAGATLEEVLAGGALPACEVLRLGAQLARGVAAIHAADIAHCDIKPSNVKITSSGVLKIVDFGLAQGLVPGALLDYERTTVLSVAGTLPYMAPEVLWGQQADERSDIFSTGAVLYEMATACRAFPQQTLPAIVEAIDKCDVIPPSAINPSLPRDLDRVVMKALHRPPARRFQQAGELADALEGLIGSAAPTAPQRRRVAARWWHLEAATRRFLPSTRQG